MNEPRVGPRVHWLYNNSILIAGGGESGSTEVFNPFTQEMQPASKMVQIHGGASLFVRASGNPLIIGGRDDAGESGATELYEFSANRWSGGPALNRGRVYHTSSSDEQRTELLVVGGYFAGIVLGSAELMEPGEVDRFVEVQALATPRLQHTQQGGYVMGGFDGARTLSSVEVFNFGSRTWTPGPPMKTPRKWHQSASLDGQIIVAGGENEEGPTATLELFDPSASSWEDLPSMGEARSRFALVVVRNAAAVRLYAIGGIGRDGAPLRSCERLRIGEPSWQSCGVLVRARSQHSAILASSSILVVGGVDAQGPTRTTEILAGSLE